jgi:hypothetical protein
VSREAAERAVRSSALRDFFAGDAVVRRPAELLGQDLHIVPDGREDRRLRVLDRLAIVLSWSDRFEPPMRRAICLLSTASVTELGVDAVAALLGLPARDVDDCLHEFEGTGLLQRTASSRYFMHPLVRLYWLHQAPEVLDADDAQSATRRLVDFLLHTAFDGERLLSPQRPAIMLTGTTSEAEPAPLRTAVDAMRWFDAENATVSAMQQAASEQGWDTAVWQLAWSMDDYLYRRGLAEPHRRAWRLGLEAAERLEDPRIIALAHLCLGRVTKETYHLEQALRLIPDDDLVSRAQAHRVMALVLEHGPGTRRSLHHAVAALRLFRVLELSVWEAVQLNAIGEQVAALGHADTARVFCRKALRLFREQRRMGEADRIRKLMRR